MNKPKSIKKNIDKYYAKKCRTNLTNIYQKTIAKSNQLSYNNNIEKVLQKSSYKIILQLD